MTAASSGEQTGEPLVVERTFDAPADLVWRAITDRDEMRRWYFDLKEFKAEKGFEFDFSVEHQGTHYHHLCKITEVVPGKRLAYTWRYKDQPGDSLVTFELFPEENKTRLKLTHTGLESFPKSPAYTRKNFEGGWTAIVGTQLKEYLQNAPREIVISREFNAPREWVWEAMTDPKHVANWWGPRGFKTILEEHDFRVGGKWRHVMCGPDGARYPNQSIFKEIVKPERIVYAHGGHREGGPGASFEATWTLSALSKDRTRLTGRLLFPSKENRDLVVKEFGVIEGGKQTLERLGEQLAGMMSTPLIISREFNAPRALVWKAWTERENLLQWFGPKGMKMTYGKLDFVPGGMFHYCLQTPDGREMWGKFSYREICAPERILWVNSFSDKDGGLTRHPFTELRFPQQFLSEATFAENAGKTTVTIKWLPLDGTEEEWKTFDEQRSSMTQGWGGTLDQLTEFLAKQA